MKRFTLKNGLTILYEKRNTASVAVEVCVKVGSLDEKPNERGISHFLEHILFEGTKNRPDTLQISNEIEKYGADFNAGTTPEATYFYIKILNKHFEIALDILSDMIKGPLFKEDVILKNRKIIVDEINMINDDPRAYQWILFNMAIYKKHMLRYPPYGDVQVVKSMSRTKLTSYFKRYYAPNNMVIAISGNVNSPTNLIKKYFGDMKKTKVSKRKSPKEPKQKKTIKKIKKDTGNSYYVLGYKTVPKGHKDTHALEVIYAILGRGQSGRFFDEVRTKRGLVYDIGINNKMGTDTGNFAVFFNCNKSKLEQIKKVIFNEFEKLQNTTKNDLKDAKTFLEGEFLLSIEDNSTYCDTLTEWEAESNIKNLQTFLKKVKKVTAKDIARVAKKYFTKEYCLVGIEQKK
jgi:predicted Zn-dependent peptidase